MLDSILKKIMFDLIIPNKEVNALFKKIIKEWFYNEMGQQNYHSFIQSLLDEDIEKFTKELSDYLIFTSSYHDFGIKRKKRVIIYFSLDLLQV